jgi:hypothetical protein
VTIKHELTSVCVTTDRSFSTVTRVQDGQPSEWDMNMGRLLNFAFPNFSKFRVTCPKSNAAFAPRVNLPVLQTQQLYFTR